MKGKFIVFEGLDGSGKTSQAQKLSQLDILQPCEFIRFPERTTLIGKQIDEYLRNKAEIESHVIHLLFSANRWEISKSIVSKLENGISLVCDRYSYSGIAYSVAKGLDFNWCSSVEIGLPEPDLIFYLEISQEEQQKIKKFGEERYEEKDFQKKVRDSFERLKGEKWVSISRGNFDEVSMEIEENIRKLLSK